MRAAVLLVVLCAGCLPSKDKAATECAQRTVSQHNWTREEFDRCYTDRGLEPPQDMETDLQ